MGRRLFLSFALALFAHLAFLPRFLSNAALLTTRPEKKPVVAAVRAMSLDEKTRAAAAKSRRDALAKEAARDEAKIPAEEEKTAVALKGQVVDLPPTRDTRPPPEARFLSEHNTRVERETRSRHATATQNPMNEVTHTARGSEREPALEELAKAKVEDRDPRRGALELPKVEAKDRLALRLDPKLGELTNQEASTALEGNSDRLRLSPGEVGQGAEAEAPKSGAALELIPKVGVLASLAGAPSNDHLEGVELGEGTFLNSREFKYASFFNRLKRGVSSTWRPLEEYRRRDPSGNIYGFRSRVTVVSITLAADGTLKEAAVTRSSGLDFLDREAVAAIERASPFPNPPKGLMDAQERISFPFGFHVDFSGAIRPPF